MSAIPFKKWLRELGWSLLILVVAMNLLSYFRNPLEAGAPLPQLQLHTLDGASINLEEIKRPVLLHFWATWCPTCRLEASNIEQLSRHYQVITIAVKSGSDAELRSYLEKNDLHFPTVNDTDGTLSSRFQVAAFPTTFIYDAEGRLHFGEVGYTSVAGLFARMWWVD